MPRIKCGVTARARHKKVLDQAKGYRGRRKNVFRIAKQGVMKDPGQYAYRDRRTRKRVFRQLWIARINAASRELGELQQVHGRTVAVTGYTQVHFDAYNHVMGSTKAKFAPFSHDGETGPPVPEPGTVLLLGAGLVTAAGVKFKRGRRQTH